MFAMKPRHWWLLAGTVALACASAVTLAQSAAVQDRQEDARDNSATAQHGNQQSNSTQDAKAIVKAKQEAAERKRSERPSKTGDEVEEEEEER